MSQYPKAKFIQSANNSDQFVRDIGAEVCFVGRSNSGKSSAINVIVNRRQFARTSKTPGRTQLVNFFELEENKRLVDLPGYGFALVSNSKKKHWGQILTHYFENRKSLHGVFMIIDIRRGLSEYDLDMLSISKFQKIPVHILMTKSDKLKRGEAKKRLLVLKSELEKSITVQLFSSLNREGLDEARMILDDLLREEIKQKT